MAFVLDASVAAAWVLPNEGATLAELALDRLGSETARVPGVFWHEMRNLLLSAERRGRTNEGYADISIVRLRRLPIHRPGGADDPEVLALAVRYGCPLASLDGRMNKATAAEGLAPFS